MIAIRGRFAPGVRAGTMFLIFAGLLFSTARPASAQSSLRMENALPVAPVRSGGPLLLAGELQWDRPDLLEGRLRFVLRSGPETLTVVESDPVVLVTGSTRFRQLLPVHEGDLGYGLSEVAVTFLGDGVAFDLGEIPVTLTGGRGLWQSVVLAVEPAPGDGLGDAKPLQQAIVFEAAMSDPTAQSRDGDAFSAQSARTVLPARDLSEQPLTYCAFDLVMLSGDGFTRLSGRQLEAIAAWGRAGGAVCIAVDRPLEEKHVQFLEELFRDSDVGPFVRDEQGVLLEPEGTTQHILAHRTGLGFSAVLFGPQRDFDFSTPAWREAHARLWRLREPYVAARRNGQPITASEFLPAMRESDGLVSYPIQSDPRGWSFPAAPFGTQIVETLRPESIRLMPGWAVLLILFGYVAIVGPLDYLVLGWFRLRKWTWLTFPAVTLAVTWGVVATANAFMSGNDHVRRVEIVDLDAEGEPVRRTTLAMYFRGSTSPIVHTVSQGWLTRLDPAHFQNDQPAQWVMRPNGIGAWEQPNVVRNDAPTGPYVGTLPARYVVSQQIAKWTPQVNRLFEIDPEIDAPVIDWDALERQQASPPYVVTLPEGRTAHVSWLESRDVAIPMSSGSSPLLGETATAVQLTERFAFQFQRSPLGLGRLDDLPFIDRTTSGGGAVSVWIHDPETGITIYRKPLRNRSMNAAR